MWTNENRAQYSRDGLRYPTDLTDAEWAEIKPLIPPARQGGNKRTVDIREVTNGLMFILGTGCQWRAIPRDSAARRTIHDYMDRWNHDGTLERMHHALYVKCREQAGQRSQPNRCGDRQPEREERRKRCYGAGGEGQAPSTLSCNRWRAPCLK